MKPRIWMYFGISFLVSLSSCVSNNVLADAHAADNNVNRLSRVSLRMSEDQVLVIMHAPYEKETYRVGADRYDVWFYVTTVTVLGQSRMVPKNLTPLTFRNNRLVGVGYDYYHWVQKREPVRPLAAPVDEEPEDRELEQQLKKASTPNGTTPPQKNQPGGSAISPSKQAPPVHPSQPVQPSQPRQPVSPQQPAPQQPSKNVPSDSKLGPPPYVPPSKPKTKEPPAQQSTMSRAPEKSSEPLPEKKAQIHADEEKPDPKKKPKWDEKDEEINEDARDQDFNYW